ncbi:MAG: ABC transporter permease, partial [Lewinella sp.]|nr:ABC transporter permease [Lewinella sp.]
FTVIGSVGANQQEKLTTKKITVLLDPAAETTPVYQMLSQDTNLEVKLQAFDRDALDTMKNTLGIVVPADFNERLTRQESAPLTIMANRSDDVLDVRQRILSRQLEVLNNQVRDQRLAAAGYSADFVTPIPVESVDIAPEEQQAGRLMGSFLPMMILLFIFIGCIYIAIDITAGEKERRTLQTLFTAPVRTREIIAGKFLAVASVGIVSAAMNLLSLLLAMNIQAYLLEAEVNAFSLSVSSTGWAWLAVLVLLATLFLGALSLAIVLLANSYKEAQSYVSPLMMLVLIPAMLSAMPGMELTMETAFIPMFNISLAIAGIFKATIEPAMLGLVAGVSLLYGLLALYLASLTFGNENIITGQKVDLKSLFSRK